jgi:short-subunit dehydrogenase
VVAAARNREALGSLAEEIRGAGGECLVVPTDVAEWEQVEALAGTAHRRYGHIDTWINNAAVSVYGTVEETSVEEFDRVLRVDLLGQIHGTKAVLPYFRSQRRGTLINVASVVARRAVPLQSAYVAAKHGVKGFTDALRMELEREKSGIQVTLILPASINTPFFDHARSKVGVRPAPLPPVYDPGAVAQALLFAATHRRREIVVGGSGGRLIAFEKLSPRLTDWYMEQGGRAFRKQTTNEPARHDDALYQPVAHDYSARGRFGDRARRTSLFTRLFEEHPMAKRICLAGALAFPLALLWTRSRPPVARGAETPEALPEPEPERMLVSA